MYGHISEYYAKERISNHLKAAEAHRLAKLATNDNAQSYKVEAFQRWLLRALSRAVEIVKEFKVKRSSPLYPKV
jgi:hypothetical protein